MFRQYSENYLRAEADRHIGMHSLDRDATLEAVPSLLQAGSDDADYFEVLADLCEVAEAEDVSNERRGAATAALLLSPFQYPDSQVRSIVGAAYAIRAFDWERAGVDARLTHGTLFEDEIDLVVDGYEFGALDNFGYLSDDEAPEHLFESYFCLADILRSAGPKALQALDSQYGIKKFPDYPTDILIGQLTPREPKVPEVPIFVATDDTVGYELGWQGHVYRQIADAANLAGALPAVYEYWPEHDPEQFFTYLSQVNRPAVGFVNGHGNHDSIAGLEFLNFAELDRRQRSKIRRTWQHAAGMTAMSCCSVSVSTVGEDPLARELANTIGRPVAGAFDEVVEVDVTYSNRGVVPTWSVGFHAAPEVGRVHGIVEPVGFDRSVQVAGGRLRARTIANLEHQYY